MNVIRKITAFIQAWPSYKKAIVPVVTLALGALAYALGAQAEIVVILTGLANALGVYKTSNS